LVFENVMKLTSRFNNIALYLNAIMMVAALAAPAAASQTEHVNWKQLCDEVVPAEARTQERHDVWVFADDHAMTTARPASVTSSDPHLQPMAFTEQTLIPLPSPEWTGLAGLAGLALIRARKSFRRIFS
jgi:hypothetical protein